MYLDRASWRSESSSTRSIRHSGPSPISRSTHSRISVRSPRSKSHAVLPSILLRPTETGEEPIFGLAKNKRFVEAVDWDLADAEAKRRAARR